MAVKTFTLPDPGEGLVEAEIVTWSVQVGQTVAVHDVVVEIETAKSLVELPIPWAGTIVELLVSEGETVPVGAPIVAVDVVGEEANLVGYGPVAGSTSRRPRRREAQSGAATPPARPTQAAPALSADPGAASQGSPVAHPAKPLATPPVRKLAKDLGVDLTQVQATGEGGIVTRNDVENHVAPSQPEPETSADPRSATGGETRIPIKGVRKVTAEAMVRSAFTAPHVTEFVSVDVTATMALLDRLRQDREFRDVKVTPLLVLAKALVIAVRRNPGINASWDGEAGEIVLKHDVNLGIAASTPRGLLVPNIKQAQTKSLVELARSLGDLVETARSGRTAPADLSGGTITISNVGIFGVDAGTPILNPGEAAILAFGAVRSMPWVVTDQDGVEQIVPRKVTQLSLSFDHRLVDGDLGSRFLADVAAIMHDPGQALVWG
ncbi:dihydrolipoamide acetyltransferase family protein [Dermacoccaceae bacterium W4C1]